MRLPTIIDNSKPDSEIHYDIGEVKPFQYPEIEEITPKLILKIENLVRGSIEYKEMVSYIKEEMNLDHCMILFNVDTDTATIDLHHHPMPLFDIVDIIARKQLEENSNCTIFTIAEEVMKCHYELIIGLIPLTRTVHQLYHSGTIDIPVQLVSFRWKEFLERYKDYFTDSQKESLQNKTDLSDKIIEDLQYPIMERRYTYLHVDNMTFVKKIDD